MRTILSTKGTYVLVDDADFVWLNQWKWSIDIGGYAVRWATNRTIRMHRLVVNAQEGEEVDHIDGNRLNNQLANLRIATHGQNQCNIRKFKANNSHGVKGVYFDKRRGTWYAQITTNGKTKCLGTFHSKVDAAIAYDQAASRLHGEFAVLNQHLINQ